MPWKHFAYVCSVPRAYIPPPFSKRVTSFVEAGRYIISKMLITVSWRHKVHFPLTFIPSLSSDGKMTTAKSHLFDFMHFFSELDGVCSWVLFLFPILVVRVPVARYARFCGTSLVSGMLKYMFKCWAYGTLNMWWATNYHVTTAQVTDIIIESTQSTDEKIFTGHK